jgi:formamidopyrimidine-DNA glycosylase
LQQQCKGRSVTIKQFIMNSKVVVGVGNIYANEALFHAGIDPRKSAGRISEKRLEVLVQRIKSVLSAAIQQGGTTLKDFVDSDGQPGYFQQSLDVYGRGGEPCSTCSRALQEVRLGQRSTVFCNDCQR